MMMQSPQGYDTGMRPMMMASSSPTYETRIHVPQTIASRREEVWDHHEDGATYIPRPAAKPRECEEECAEEECLDADQCGAEHRPPKPENLCFGVDTRPLLPIGLAVSTVIGALIMMVWQIPHLSRLLGISETIISAGFLAIYALTFGCMSYCAFADPGQLKQDRGSQGLAGAPQGGDPPLPKRAYQSWQYRRPIRRYDHYCRWLSNCIGLLNHREFVAMLVGLVGIGVLGTAVDTVLAVSLVRQGFSWGSEILILLHLAYSVTLLAMALPIFRIHSGLVSRNEMAAEWKRNDFYVAKHSKHGKDIPVNELSDDEFNALFDSFVYDKSKNTFDNGCPGNCFNFWCVARWAKDELGEF